MSENNQFQRNYTLQQHTMLLHFQADNNLDGRKVCLRASEVKPKLDRYLTRILGGNSKVPTEWIQQLSANKTDISYRYQMRIEQKEPNTARITDDIPKIFYGNMSNGENESGNKSKKRGVYFPNGLMLTITCFIPDLLLKIDEIIGDFFIATNFGTMQGKGFGSFTVDKRSTDQICETLIRFNDAKKCYYFEGGANRLYDKIGENKCLNEQGQDCIFARIKQVYSVMKSGSRVPYYRSYIYQYMHTKQIGNEKAKMKLTQTSPDYKPKRFAKPESLLQEKLEHYYVRAVLGIGSRINYITDIDGYNMLDKNGQIKYDKRGNPIRAKEPIVITHTEKDEKKRIERYASPVFFKVIEGTVYMIGRKGNDDILGKEFTFTNNDKNTKQNPKAGNSCTLNVVDSFDIDDFLSCYVKDYNNQFIKKVGVADCFRIQEYAKGGSHK